MKINRLFADVMFLDFYFSEPFCH